MSKAVAKLELQTDDFFAKTPLDSLAKRINEGHEGIRSGVRRLAVDVAQVGSWLVAAKTKCEHGEWLPWLAKHCAEVSEDTAQRYMRIYRAASKTAEMRYLTPTQAYKLLGIVKEDDKADKKAKREAQAADDVPEESVKPSIEAVSGRVYLLGPHVLYCGDSSIEQFRASCRSRSFALAFADPPYNEETQNWDSGFKWQHDYLADVAPIVAVTPGISNIQSFMCTTKMPYKWALSYFINNGMTRGAIGFGNWMFVALFSKESIHRNAQDHYEVSVVGSDRDPLHHKGRKPMGILRGLLDLFTKPGELVLDPFLGTGTTLIAAEEMGRVCIGAEIDPKFCGSIIARWEQKTGKKAAQHE